GRPARLDRSGNLEPFQAAQPAGGGAAAAVTTKVVVDGTPSTTRAHPRPLHPHEVTSQAAESAFNFVDAVLARTDLSSYDKLFVVALERAAARLRKKKFNLTDAVLGPLVGAGPKTLQRSR